MTIHLHLKTKNFQSLKIFTSILFNICSKNKINSIKYRPSQSSHSFVSLLKSPHVNKTAQEQFEFKISHRNIIFNTVHSSKLLIILRYFYSKLFPDIKIKILSSSFRKPNTHISSFQVATTDVTFLLNSVHRLKILDFKGENIFKNSLNSSVGRAKD